MKNIIPIALVFTTFISCSKPNPIKNDDNIEIIDFDIAMSENNIESFNDYIDSVYLLPLETNDSCFIRGIRKLIITNDRIIIFDPGNSETAVLIFDLNGKFINSIKYGQGPTEIVKAYHIAYNSEKEEIVVRQHSRFSYFTKNGDYINDVDFELYFTDFAIYNNEYIFKDFSHNRNPWLNELAEYYIFFADSNLNITHVGLPFYYDTNFSSSKEIFTTPECVYITMMANDTIFKYKDNVISPAYILKYSDKKYDEIPKTNEILNDIKEKKSGYCFFETFENCDSHQFLCIDNDKLEMFTYLIRNKKTKNCICKIIPRKDLFNGCRTYVIPCASYNDFFIRDLYQENIEENKKNIEPFLSEKDKAVLNNFKDEDNPILMFYRFKDF